MRDSGLAPPIPPIIVIGFGIVAVSSASIFIRYAQVFAPSLVIAAYRLTLASLVLAPVALTRQRGELSAIGGSSLRLALLSGFFLALHFASWITSLEYTTVASSVVLVTTTPLWVGLLSPWTIKEPLTRPILIGMMLALVGGVAVGVSDYCSFAGGRLLCPNFGDFMRGGAFLGDLLALFGAWMAAGYILIGRRLRSGMSVVSYVFLVYGAAAILLIGIMFSVGQKPWGYPPITYLWFVLLALIPQLIGHSSFNWALQYLQAAYVSITLLGEPVGSTILAYFLLGERPTAFKIFGAILILVGIYLASQSEGLERRRQRLVRASLHEEKE